MFSRKAYGRSSARSGNKASLPKFKLIIGLGNPGEEYKDSYHNVGYRFVDHLNQGEKFKETKSFRYFKKSDLTLVKPLTSMNESARAVREAINYFKMNLKDVLIVHDDSDIALGKYKISFDRNSAGHKGVESIIKSLGTKNFHRLRIGIRTSKGKAGEFVLKPIRKADSAVLEGLFSEIQALNLKIQSERYSAVSLSDQTGKR